MFEKSQADARRLRIRRVAAMSISVSEVCTLYSCPYSSVDCGQARRSWRSTIQVRPVILNARCRRLTICSFQPSCCSRCRASWRLWCPASAMTVRMFGNNAPKPPSNRAAALRSEMSAGSTLHAMSSPEGVHQNVALAAFDTLVHVEAANAAAFRRLHRLAIHDDDRRTGGPTGLPSSLLVH